MMRPKKNQHQPWRTFVSAISLPFIASIIIYIIFNLSYSNHDGGSLVLAIILTIFSFIPSLLFALAVTLKFKPIYFSTNQNAFIWASMNATTALLVGLFSSGLTDMQGLFTNGTGWFILSYSLVGFCVGRFLVQSNSTTQERHVSNQLNQNTQTFTSDLKRPVHSTNQATNQTTSQVTKLTPPLHSWKGTLGLSIINLCLILIVGFANSQQPGIDSWFHLLQITIVVLFIQFIFTAYLLCSKRFAQACISTVFFTIFVSIGYIIFRFIASQ